MSENKKIEIISDNGKRIQISKVYDHIEMEKPKEKKEDIVIPKVKKNK